MLQNTRDIVQSTQLLATALCTKKKTLLLTFNIFHDHAQVPPCLKRAVHGHNKRVLSKGKDVSLHKGLLYLIPQNQVLLVDLFHGKPLLRLLVPNQVNGSVK